MNKSLDKNIFRHLEYIHDTGNSKGNVLLISAKEKRLFIADNLIALEGLFC